MFPMYSKLLPSPRASARPETKILPATEAELARETEVELADMENAFGVKNIDQEPIDKTKMARVTYVEADDLDSWLQLHEDGVSISSLIAELPTPVNVSSASKFFQDKCLSNHAWAKLSGLPSCEIGPCEWALRQALEWRLWVGKSEIQMPSSSPPSTRNIIRSQSESSTLPSSTISTSASLPPVGKPL